MIKEKFYSNDLREFETLGIKEETVQNAHLNEIYENDNFSYWSERKKFYRVILNLRGSNKTVNIEALGTDFVIETVRFDTGEEALIYYLEILAEDTKTFYLNHLVQDSIVLIIPTYYITDILFKIFLLPVLMIFQMKDIIRCFKKEVNTFDKIVNRLFKKTWVDFDSFNEYKILFYAIYVVFFIGVYFF